MRSLCVTAAALAVLLVSVCNAQVPFEAGLSGDSHCGKGYCFTAIYVPSTSMINYTLVVPQGGQSGWWGVAQGEEMVGANMAINWVNEDGTLTTSHRGAQSHDEPKEEFVTIPGFSINKDQTRTSDTQTVWSWNFKINKNFTFNAYSHIAAHSDVNPTSSNTDATITKHTQHEHVFRLNLQQKYNGTVPAGFIPWTSSSSGSNGSSMSGGANVITAPASNTSTGLTTGLATSGLANVSNHTVGNITTTNGNFGQVDSMPSMVGGNLIGAVALLVAGWLALL